MEHRLRLDFRFRHWTWTVHRVHNVRHELQTLRENQTEFTTRNRRIAQGHHRWLPIDTMMMISTLWTATHRWHLQLAGIRTSRRTEQHSVVVRWNMSCTAPTTLVKLAMNTWRQLKGLKSICEDSRNCWRQLALTWSRKTVKSWNWRRKLSSCDSSKHRWAHQKNAQSRATAIPSRLCAKTQRTTCTRQHLKSHRRWLTWLTTVSNRVHVTLQAWTELLFTMESIKFTLSINCAIRRCKVRSLTLGTLRTSQRRRCTRRILMLTRKIGELLELSKVHCITI